MYSIIVTLRDPEALQLYFQSDSSLSELLDSGELEGPFIVFSEGTKEIALPSDDIARLESRDTENQ